MKITVKKNGRTANISENLEISGDANVILEISDITDKVKTNASPIDKLAFLFYELESISNIELQPDDELKKLLKSLDSDSEADEYIF